MKKIILVIAIAIGCLSGVAVQAQTNADSYKQELRTYMTTSGSTASFDMMVNQLFMMAGGIPAEKKAEIRTQAFDKLVDLMTPVYQKNITLEDLKEINKFYQTPAGKRIAEAQPKIAVESTQVGQQWGMWLQSAIQSAAK
ncbi:DUF2059 domain-containing protein [Alistipes timonensis]